MAETRKPAAVAPATEAPAVTAPVVATPPRVPEVIAAVVPAVTVHAMAKPAAAPVVHKPAPAPARLSNPRKPVAPSEQIKTLAGDVYNNVYVEKTMADGIIISYTPQNGGLAMTKIQFDELPNDLRLRYEPKPKNPSP